MIDLGVNVGVNTDQLEAELRKAFAAFIAQSSKAFDKMMRDLSKNAGKNLKNNLGDAAGFTDAFNRRVQETVRLMGKLEGGVEAAGQSIGGAFNPKSFDPFEEALKRIIVLQDKIDRGVGDPKRNQQELRAALAALVSTRKLAQEVTVDQRQQARVAIQQSRATTSRYVVDQQTQASAARDASKRAIEATKAQARQRVAIIQAAARTMATIERGLSKTFQSTASVLSNGLRGLTGVATSAVNGIAGAFRKGNTNITNNTNSALSQVSTKYSSTFKNATSTVTNETRKQASVINNFAREAKGTLGTIGSGAQFGIGAAIGGILGVGAAKALQGGFQRASTIETAEIALTKLIGSAEEAKALLTEVTEVVTGTPFALDQFASATTKLLAYNIEAGKIPDILRAAGDAAAIAGPNAAQAIDSILTSIGQINTVGRASLEEVKVIAEAGVPAFKILGNALGVTTEELRDMFEKGLVPAGVAIDALTKGILEGTDGVNGATAAFGGLAKGLGDTLAGSVSNFNTSIKRLGAGVITAFQKPFTAAMGAATAAVDLFGSALKILAQQVQASPTFQLIQRGLVGLTKALKEAKEELAPFFSFISGGIVVLGQAAVALYAFKSIPKAIRLVGTAIKFVLAPQRLLIAGAILVASYFKKLYDESKDLRDALGKVGDVIKRIATVVRDLAVDSFKSFSGAAEETGGVVRGFGRTVLDIVIPAIEKFGNFLLDTVLPAVRDFAKFVREEVLPNVGKALARAVEIGKAALEGLASFIKETLVPTVGPILKRAVEIGTEAFRASYDFLANTLVPFIRDNLTPILAGVGVALGALALSGGNLPLAGLAGLTAGIAAALSDDDIRNALTENLTEAFETVKERAKEIFTGDTALAIVKSVAKVAYKIGKVLGDVITDPRLWTAAGAIAAAGAFVAVSFIGGFAEGIINNIPEIISALSKAIQAALKAVFSSPKFAALFLTLLASAAIIASVAKAGKKIGKTFSESLYRGTTEANFSGAKGNFFASLFGGRAAIDRQIKEEYTRQRRTITREKQRLQRFVQQATGDVVRGQGGLFADAKQVAAGAQIIEDRIGPLNTAAAKLRQGFSDLGTGFKNFKDSSYFVTDGLRSIGEGLKAAGPTIAATAGAIAGGAFAASFVSQALFDIDSTGVDKLQAGVGLLATAISTGAAVALAGGGTPLAIGAGVAVGAVGLVTSAMQAGEEQAKRARQEIEAFAEVLAELSGAEAAIEIQERVLDAFTDTSIDATNGILGLRISYKEFSDALQDGTGIEFVAKELEKFGPQGEFFAEKVRDGTIAIQDLDKYIKESRFGGLGRQIAEAGLAFDPTIAAFGVLGDQIVEVGGALGEADLEGQVKAIGAAGSEAEARMAGLQRQQELNKSITEATTLVTDTYKNKLAELNEIRLDGFRERLDEAKGKLDAAKRAADDAKAALTDLLNPPKQATGQEAVDDVVLGIDGLVSTIGEIQTTNPLAGFGTGLADATVRSNIEDIRTEIAGILDDAPDAAAAQKIIDDIKAAFAGAPGGNVLNQVLDESLATFNAEPFQTALAKSLDLAGAVTTAEGQVETRETLLANALGLDPATLTGLNTQALTAAQEAAETVITGYNESLADPTADQTGTTSFFEKSVQAALDALDANSPSKEFKKIGVYAVDGYQLGLREGFARVALTTKYLGIASMQGLTAGLIQGSVVVFRVARSIADGIAAIMESALQINSPSKVMQGVGMSIGEGIAKGIEETAQLSADAATATMDGVLNAASAAVGSGATINSNIVATGTAVAVPAASGGLTEADIVRIGQVIADRAKPNVQIDQTFNQPVDSRAVASDVAWRLTA